MRLIDADKLPYAMKDYFDGKKTIGQIIDDAPTVEMAEDCVKRDDVKSGMIKYGFLAPDMTVTEFVEDLPSVQPQPKKGKWNRVIDKAGHWVWECDKCGWQQRFNTNYCPDCGADMREVQDDGI